MRSSASPGASRASSARSSSMSQRTAVTLFDSDRQPTLDTTHAVEAVDALCRIAHRGPTALPSWHYDDVDAALGAGIVDMAATWPGGFAALRGSRAAPHLSPHPYLSGPAGLRSYSGCHGWAMPRTCGDVPAALDAIRRLSTFDAHALDAESGTVCAHVDAFASVTPLDAIDAARLDIIRATIADGMITYPPLPRFPEIEDAGWSSINAAPGELPPRPRRGCKRRRKSSCRHRWAAQCAARCAQHRLSSAASRSQPKRSEGWRRGRTRFAPVPSWTPHKLANPLTGQIELKVGAKCEAIVDLPERADRHQGQGDARQRVQPPALLGALRERRRHRPARRLADRSAQEEVGAEVELTGGSGGDSGSGERRLARRRLPLVELLGAGHCREADGDEHDDQDHRPRSAGRAIQSAPSASAPIAMRATSGWPLQVDASWLRHEADQRREDPDDEQRDVHVAQAVRETRRSRSRLRPESPRR